MSLPAIPLPGKLSDARFIGDLMSLFERRKVKCGDAQSFDHFTTELVSNNAFRSDLLTLCMAISHMAAEDLSGEQLLSLVARALVGPGAAKGAAVPEIPATMRTVFLGGYEAWNNRAIRSMEEDSWPPPRKAVPREEPALPAEVASEPVAAKSAAESGRTFQEALEIAKERSPNGLLTPRSSAPGPNLEHLTISELKNLLEEIESRVSRIGPHLSQTFSAPPEDAGRGVRPNRADGVETPDLPTVAAEPARADVLRAPRGAVLPFESAGRPAPPAAPMPPQAQDEGEEDPFMRRHPYLKQMVRTTPGAEIAAALAKTSASAAPAAGVPAAAVASLPTAFARVASVAAALPDPPDAPPLLVRAAAPVSGLPAVVELTPPPAEVTKAVVARARTAVIEPDEWYPPGGDHINIRIKVGGILAVAGFFVLIGCLSGIFVYHSMHPKTIDDFPDLKTPAPSILSQTDPNTEVILALPDASTEVPQRTSRSGGTGVSKPKASPSLQTHAAGVAVWPPSNQASRDVSAEAAAARRAARLAQSSATSAANRPAGPVTVPATTMIGYAVYAPKPAYPADQANGISGTVELEVSISKRGNVTSARALGGAPELQRAAEQAVEEWRFRPYLVDGEPTEVTTTVGFFFNGR